MRPFRSATIVFLLFAFLTLPLATFAQGSEIYFITDVDCASAFPQVTFKLRAVDLSNQVVTTLGASNVTVFENGQQATNVNVTPQSDGPINYIFVIDQGQLNNYRSFGLANLRQAFSTLVSGGFFKDGVDRVMVLARQNINGDQTVTWLRPTQLGSDLTTFIANFNFDRSRNRTTGLLSVQDAIDEMAKLVPVPGSETSVIIFVTYFVENPATNPALASAQNIASVAKGKNISLYVFQTSNFQPSPLQTLTTGANGTYTQIKASTVVQDVSNVYQSISSQRTFYTVSYRSTLSASGQRQITINSANPTGQGVTGTCQANVLPPAVSISQPAPNSTIARSAQSGAGGTPVFDINDVTVVADVTWPDKPRLLKSVELYVDGKLEREIEPGADDTHFELTWDLSDINTPGSNQVQLQVKAVDELGLEASDTRTVTVAVSVPPTPTPTAPPLIPIPGPVDGGSFWSQLLTVGGVVCLGLLCILPFSFLIFYMTRPTQAKKMVADIRHTLIGGAPASSKALATVSVVAGPKELINEKINISKAITTLGRNPKVADIVFYPDEESSVSRLHCTIQMDGKAFKLTDNGSTSGTRVNGRRIQPNDPTELRDGDEIVLGDLGKLGVKLKFGFLMDKTQLPSSGTASDKTFIMDDFHSDDWDKYKDN